MYIESKENLGCNLFCTKTIPCRKPTDAYRGLKVAPVFLAHSGPDRNRQSLDYTKAINCVVMTF